MARQIWDDHAPLPRRPQDDGNERDTSAPEPNRAARQETKSDADPDAEPVTSRHLGEG